MQQQATPNSQVARVIGVSSVYEIDPRRFRKSKTQIAFLVIFWLIWFPMTCFATLLLFSGGPTWFLLLWLSLAWIAVFTIPIAVAQRNRKQILTAAGDRLLLSGLKLFSSSPVELHKKDLIALTLENHDDGDVESIYTLNLLQKPGAKPKRVLLAQFIHPEGKAILFNEIAQFLTANGFVFESKNTWTR